MKNDFKFIMMDAARWAVAAIVSLAVILSVSMLYKTLVPAAPVTDTPAASGEIVYQHVNAPKTDRENGVVSAEEWAAVYPEIVASYKANSENTYRISYLAEDQDPYLVNIYEGYGFAKDYTSAIGHEYCLEDVMNTQRPHPLANCLTCKTADYTALVNKLGVEAYSLSFDEVAPNMSENVGCYNCHENQAGDAGKLVVTHDYIIENLGDAMSSIDDGVLSCGQCHIEYYFKPDTKATSIPYTDIATMTPDAILEYYDSIDFADWTQESTGTRLLKAQHPEMETFLNGSIHASMGMSCADCHMAVTTTNGVTYTSHELVSPLNSPAILDTCTKCHGDTDMAAKVHAIQDEITARETELGNKLSDLKDQLAEAVASGSYTEEELNAIRQLHRSAQWFFDYDYVENAEGAHNSSLARYCLDKAEALMDEAFALFK